jgi:hypothetical protein
MHPAEAIKFIHIAIRREAQGIEAEAAVADSPAELVQLGERVARFHQINKLHTDGEEVAMYADLEHKLPHVRGAYLHDHHEDHVLFGDVTARINAAATATGATRPGLLAGMRRQTIALTEHLLPHVEKEDVLITPLLVEHFTPAEQGGQIGRLMANFPPEVMARTLPWMITHLDPDDRVAYVGVIQKIMPPERFGIACGWIRAGVAADLWSAIASSVPGCPA